MRVIKNHEGERGPEGNGAAVCVGLGSKVVLATFSDILMSRTDLVDDPVWACRTFSRGARPQIAAAYPPPATPELAQA